jgi:hypothetical protein
LTAAALRRIASIQSLEDLNLDCSLIAPQSLEQLATLPRLRKLSLSVAIEEPVATRLMQARPRLQVEYVGNVHDNLILDPQSKLDNPFGD